MTQVRQDTGGHVSAEGVCTDPLLPAVRQALAVTARSLAGSTTRIPTLLRRLQTVCSLSVSPAGCRRLPTPAVHILLGRSAAPHWKMPLIHGTVQTRRGGWSMTASSFGELALTTHRSHRRLSQRATGLIRNLTLARVVDTGVDGDSGHSQVAIIDLGMVPAERQHPKIEHSHCRPP